MIGKKENNDKIDGWLELLSDEARADVLKTHIAETENTKRKRLEEEEHSHRENIGTDGYHVIRALWPIAIMAAIAASTCVGYRTVDAIQSMKEQQIRAEHPNAAPPPPAASAAGAPAGSAK